MLFVKIFIDWTRGGTADFLGPKCGQGQRWLGLRMHAYLTRALILMGDWYGARHRIKRMKYRARQHSMIAKTEKSPTLTLSKKEYVFLVMEKFVS
jgi:hypothetical protein